MWAAAVKEPGMGPCPRADVTITCFWPFCVFSLSSLARTRTSADPGAS
jgi:hypothetical protein